MTEPRVRSDSLTEKDIREDTNSIIDRVGSLIDDKLKSFRQEIIRTIENRPKTDSSLTIRGETIGERDEPLIDSFPPSPTVGPPIPPPQRSGEEWTKILGRKSKKKIVKHPDLPNPPPSQNSGQKGKKKEKANEKARPTPRLTRTPRIAAIIMTAPEGKYADAIRLAREKISLADFDIKDLTAKRAMTGAMKIEIPGKDGREKAIKLAIKMDEVLAPQGVKVVCPMKCADLCIRGLDDSATSAAVSMAIAQAGECSEGVLKVGEIRRSPSGIGTVWIQCPLNVARKLT